MQRHRRCPPLPSAKIKKHHNLRCDALWSGRRGSNSLPGIPRTALRRFAGALPHLGFNAPAAQVEAARSLRLTKNRTSKSDVLFTMERATRLELASRHPTNRLTAIRRSPASPRIQCACGAGGGSAFSSSNKKQDIQIGCPVYYGAGDEARTRYLHLGKVALYQMSYARGTRCTIPDIFRFVKHRF